MTCFNHVYVVTPACGQIIMTLSLSPFAVKVRLFRPTSAFARDKGFPALMPSRGISLNCAGSCLMCGDSSSFHQFLQVGYNEHGGHHAEFTSGPFPQRQDDSLHAVLV